MMQRLTPTEVQLLQVDSIKRSLALVLGTSSRKANSKHRYRQALRILIAVLSPPNLGWYLYWVILYSA